MLKDKLTTSSGCKTFKRFLKSFSIKQHLNYCSICNIYNDAVELKCEKHFSFFALSNINYQINFENLKMKIQIQIHQAN